MLPTPAKFHYVFNLRDLSRIWEGMLNITQEVFETTSDALALWKHECSRVIADRFTNEKDTDWFEKALSQVLAEEIDEQTSALMHEEPYFVDFLRYEIFSAKSKNLYLLIAPGLAVDAFGSIFVHRYPEAAFTLYQITS